MTNSKIIPKLFILFILVFSSIVIIFGCISHYTFTGVVVENAYQKGLDFNKIYQTSLIKPSNAIKADIAVINNIVNLTITGDFKPELDGSIEAKIIKPVSSQYDMPLVFLPTGKDNCYQANLPLLPKGIWEIRIKIIKNGDSDEFVFNRRFQAS